MAKFGYLSIRKMETRPGVKYATEYYKLHKTSTQKLKAHIERCATICVEAGTDSVVDDHLKKGIGSHYRKDGTAYTTYDVLTDALSQLIAGKDMPKAMINRWNKVFGNTEYSIEMVLEADMPSHNLLDQLFS
jgi:hypothetical protein|tara:strand:- start:2127 stop:2522 length:396 start_codon:yes stop_codon:yes gene_type:complete